MDTDACPDFQDTRRAAVIQTQKMTRTGFSIIREEQHVLCNIIHAVHESQPTCRYSNKFMNEIVLRKGMKIDTNEFINMSSIN